MKVVFTEKLKPRFKRLPKNIQKKISKQFLLLSQNLRHPSIRCKKLEGSENLWEGRVDHFYRFIFIIENDVVTIIRIGPHDEALGKK